MLKILVWEKSGFCIYYKRLKKNKSKKKWVTLNWVGRSQVDYERTAFLEEREGTYGDYDLFDTSLIHDDYPLSLITTDVIDTVAPQNLASGKLVNHQIEGALIEFKSIHSSIIMPKG